AQSYRAYGTAAEYVAVPAAQAVPLADDIAFEQGACLGIPGITAHRAVHVAGDIAGMTVLVQGGAGAVGQCAIALARHAGARVIATVRSSADQAIASEAGAHEIVPARAEAQEIVQRIRSVAPDGVDHVIEVAFHANVEIDAAVLRNGGSIATYASGEPKPHVPFWPLVFKNVAIHFLGSDDFPPRAKEEAARDINAALAAGWKGFAIGARYPLDRIAAAHERVEDAAQPGRTVLVV
ncbi:MAG TPA: zinc-binding dehydrogenase, partial [Casimicrobiaceae bacterium]|nr:zinc-binding dehydrogenase [Casimicrobiaceae bacterium]